MSSDSHDPAGGGQPPRAGSIVARPPRGPLVAAPALGSLAADYIESLSAKVVQWLCLSWCSWWGWGGGGTGWRGVGGGEEGLG